RKAFSDAAVDFAALVRQDRNIIPLSDVLAPSPGIIRVQHHSGNRITAGPLNAKAPSVLLSCVAIDDLLRCDLFPGLGTHAREPAQMSDICRRDHDVVTLVA